MKTTTQTLAACAVLTHTQFKETTMKVKLFVQVDDTEVGLAFAWDDDQKAWVCKMDDNFMQELGALPMEETE